MRIALPAIALVLLCAPGTGTAADPPSKEQVRCTVALHDAGVRVAAAAAARIVQCVRDAGQSRLRPGQTADQCAATADGLVARVLGKTARVAAKRCAAVPTFGPTTADAVNLAFQRVVDVHAVFGPSLQATLVPRRRDKRTAACQLAVAKGLGLVAVARLRAFAACSAAGLKNGSITDTAGLEACFDAGSSKPVAKAVASARRLAAKRCATADIAPVFPGECATEPLAAFTSCLEWRTACDACLLLNAGEGATKLCPSHTVGVEERLCGLRPQTGQSVARQWDEEALAAVRRDTPRPMVHTRTLFHLSAAMYDAWVAYQATADPFLTREAPASSDVEADRAEAISFAAYRVLRERFKAGPGATTSLAAFDARMQALGYDKAMDGTTGDGPAAVGNRIAAAMLAYGRDDGANEIGSYADLSYVAVNPPLIVQQPGTTLVDPNRWQPLALDRIIGQDGNPVPAGVQRFLGPQWGGVKPFALTRDDPLVPYMDPGPPPQLSGIGDAQLRARVRELVERSSLLDPGDPTTVDVSPGVQGDNTLGADDGTGHATNPSTGGSYAPNVVKRADYLRVVAELWARGPRGEGVGGYWNVLANQVSDAIGIEKRIGGSGPIVERLEWDVKLYFALNAAEHDATVVAWGLKRRYDGVRPVSLVRHMGCCGQSTDPSGSNYNPELFALVPDLIEVISAATTGPGQRHEALAGHNGEIALRAWSGPPADPSSQAAGVRWIRAIEWFPYQEKSFVTAGFPGYVSEHSTISRAAAVVLASLTGNPFFPAGLFEVVAARDAFLTVELGPSTDVVVQWATFADAADQAGAAQRSGGTQLADDDLTGRRLGADVGAGVWAKALRHFDGTEAP